MRTLLVCLLAGGAAGLGTGFAGLSAATVIAPMLIAFLGCPWYEAVGIGLASDVLASAISAVIYRRHGNVDVRGGVYMVLAVLSMTVLGSFCSQFMPSVQMGYLSIFGALLMGFRFLLYPEKKDNARVLQRNPTTQRNLSILCGAGIGFYCGFMGIGGGLMMLFILTCILEYDVKIAVGTSVFVMTFTAFTGAASHFYFGDISSYLPALILCSVFTLVGAVVASRLANNMSAIKTNRATGLTLLVLGVGMVVESVLGL